MAPWRVLCNFLQVGQTSMAKCKALVGLAVKGLMQWQSCCEPVFGSFIQMYNEVDITQMLFTHETRFNTSNNTQYSVTTYGY